MKNENYLHVRFGYSEALDSKRDLLSGQMSFLKMATTIKKFKKLRESEQTKKIEALKTLKQININIRKMEQILPKIKIPSILKKDENEDEYEEAIEKVQEKEYKETLDKQLQEIQERLLSLE